MKRTSILLGLACLTVATPALAQQDGEWQVKNPKVEAKGTATEGTCDPPTFELTIELLFGSGHRVETVQGPNQRTEGTFDPETGKIETSGGAERYVLEPEGQKGLTGFNYYKEGERECRWALDLTLDKPGLVSVEPEATPDAAPSPSVPPEPAAPPAATGDEQQRDRGSAVGRPSALAMAYIGGGVTVGGLVAYTAVRRRRLGQRAYVSFRGRRPSRGLFESKQERRAREAKGRSTGPLTGEETRRLGDILGTPDRSPPESPPKDTPEP